MDWCVLGLHSPWHSWIHSFLWCCGQTTFQTECGQLLDTLCMNLTLEDFTVDRWTLIVKSVTTHTWHYSSSSPLFITVKLWHFVVYSVCVHDKITDSLVYHSPFHLHCTLLSMEPHHSCMWWWLVQVQDSLLLLLLLRGARDDRVWRDGHRDI